MNNNTKKGTTDHDLITTLNYEGPCDGGGLNGSADLSFLSCQNWVGKYPTWEFALLTQHTPGRACILKNSFANPLPGKNSL